MNRRVVVFASAEGFMVRGLETKLKNINVIAEYLPFKLNEITKNIPVMFLTGKGDKESIMKVLSLKPAGYLLKTIERAKLR